MEADEETSVETASDGDAEADADVDADDGKDDEVREDEDEDEDDKEPKEGTGTRSCTFFVLFKLWPRALVATDGSGASVDWLESIRVEAKELPSPEPLVAEETVAEAVRDDIVVAEEVRDVDVDVDRGSDVVALETATSHSVLEGRLRLASFVS